jgi:hypothetical protein
MRVQDIDFGPAQDGVQTPEVLQPGPGTNMRVETQTPDQGNAGLARQVFDLTS